MVLYLTSEVTGTVVERRPPVAPTVLVGCCELFTKTTEARSARPHDPGQLTSVLKPVWARPMVAREPGWGCPTPLSKSGVPGDASGSGVVGK